MKIIAINGSPRKNWNTATLLKKVLEGAVSQGAETELINLYDLQYKGCISCFSCKRKTGKHGECAMKDDLTPILEKLKEVDAIVFGSPLYFTSITAGMKAFLERFLFSNSLYSSEIPTVFPNEIQSGIIYTMNVTKEMIEQYEFNKGLSFYEMVIGTTLGKQPEVLYSYDTYQFSDYEKYESSIFSEEEKAKQKAEQFPIDCEKAFNMGVQFVKNA